MSRVFPFRLRLCCALWAAVFVAGCASPPEAMLDSDLEAFTAGVGAVIKSGMTMREARAVLHERFPPPSVNTQAPAPASSGNSGFPVRRYMLGWPTLDPETTLVLTIYCDRDGHIVHWTTGPLYSAR